MDPSTTTTTTSTTSTTTTTTAKITTTTTGKYTTTTTAVPENITTTASPFIFQRCYDDLLSESQSNIAKYLMYVCAGWIILWCVITILVNLCHRNTGQHRFVHFFEELSIIALAVFMFVLNFVFDKNYHVCKFISVFIHFFMCLTAAIFLAESLFASSMVHGKSDKNGSLPWICYYILPIILAVLPTLGAYFSGKKYYGTSGLHCFAVSTVDMLWKFVIPVWVFLTLAGFKSQLACIACDRQQESQDLKQCYWARRSVKSLVLISQFLFSIWLMVLFSAEHQRLYLFILTLCMSIVFGPALFVCHTFGHLNTCQKWSGEGCFGSLYAMCPPKPMKTPPDSPRSIKEEKHPYEESEPKSLDSPKVEPKSNEIKRPKSRDSNIYPETKTTAPFTQGPNKHTESQKFYSWLTMPGGAEKSGDILFTPAIH